MAIDDITANIRAARELREHLLSDRHRPGYHFAMPEDIGRPGDPNGAFYANGRYRLMYLYDRQAITRRVYPEGGASDGVALFARGGSATCGAIRGWEMAPSNPF